MALDKFSFYMLIISTSNGRFLPVVQLSFDKITFTPTERMQFNTLQYFSSSAISMDQFLERYYQITITVISSISFLFISRAIRRLITAKWRHATRTEPMLLGGKAFPGFIQFHACFLRHFLHFIS